MKKNQSNTYALKKRARTKLYKGQLADAIKLYTQACEKNPQDPEAWFMLAGIHAQTSNMSGIIQCCQQLLKLQPDNPQTHYNIACAYQSINQMPEAIGHYRKALDIQKDHIPSMTNLAITLWQQGELDQAEELCKKLLTGNQIPPAIINCLGLIYTDRGDTDKATTHFEQAIREHPQQIDLYINLAKIVQKDDTPRALNLCQQALQKDPDSEPAHNAIAEQFYLDRDYTSALKHYQAVQKISPQSLEASFNLGRTYFALDKSADAIKHYQSVLQQSPQHINTLNNLAKVYDRNGQAEQADEYYNKALALDPDNSAIITNLARLVLQQGDYEKSEDIFLQAIKANPENDNACFGLAQAYTELGQTDKAIEYYERVLEINSDSIEAPYLLEGLRSKSAKSAESNKYIANLFDKYADKFDDELVKKLGYKTPTLINKYLRDTLETGRGKLDILDLGCGTGLCGILIKDISQRLVGIDLSAEMIQKAREQAEYDELIVGGLVECMADYDEDFDIVLAADVFVYVGDLDASFQSTRKSLRDQSLFIFSTETIAGESFMLRGSGRYAHSCHYINTLAEQYDFRLLKHQDVVLRKDYTQDIQGTIYILQKNEG